MADAVYASRRDAGKAPTIEQVAARAGVSTVTVSRVVSGRGTRMPTRLIVRASSDTPAPAGAIPAAR